MGLPVGVKCVFHVTLKYDLFPASFQWLFPDKAKVQHFCLFLAGSTNTYYQVGSPFEPSDHTLVGKWRASFNYHTNLQFCQHTWSNDEEHLLACGSSKLSCQKGYVLYWRHLCFSWAKNVTLSSSSIRSIVSSCLGTIWGIFLSGIIIFASGISFSFLLKYLSIYIAIAIFCISVYVYISYYPTSLPVLFALS
jgi:hypothetical protein